MKVLFYGNGGHSCFVPKFKLVMFMLVCSSASSSLIYSNVCANAADFASYTLVASMFLRTKLNTSATQISHALKSLVKRNSCRHFCLHILIWYSNVLPFWVNISNVSYSNMKHFRVAYMSFSVSVSLLTTLVNVSLWSPEGDNNLCS